MSALVSLLEAKDHLRVTDDDSDSDIASKVLTATDIVIDYIERPAHGWTEETVPWRVKGAILLVLGALFHDREGGDPLSDGVIRLLWRLRDPVIA
jgi:hypothetical protein